MTESKSATGKAAAAKPTPTEPAPLADNTAGAPTGESKIQYRTDGLPTEIPIEDGRVVPTPGDPRTEPVATAEQSHVAGRVGPRTFGEDTTSALVVDELAPVEPGEIRRDTPEGTGPVLVVGEVDPVGEHQARISRELNRRAEAGETVKRQGPVQVDPELAALRNPDASDRKLGIRP